MRARKRTAPVVFASCLSQVGQEITKKCGEKRLCIVSFRKKRELAALSEKSAETALRTMDTLSYKTRSLPKEAVERSWWVIDAKGMVLGRMASRVAILLRGKHKASYTPHINCGDKVIVINAERVHFTGRKWDDKVFQYYTGYPGGQREITMDKMREKDATKIIENAVRRMLPKNKLGNDLFRNLYVYNGEEHPHTAQNPQPYDLKIS